MANVVKVKWLGGPGEPDTNEWNGVSFARDKWVEVSDVAMIAAAKRNRFYEVEGEADAAKAKKAGGRNTDAQAKAEENARAREDLSARAHRK